jgi:hypothetical protein
MLGFLTSCSSEGNLPALQALSGIRVEKFISWRRACLARPVPVLATAVRVNNSLGLAQRFQKQA